MTTNLSVIGLQWGDEGKGKIVDYLSQHVEAVVRFQGGNNAGHTLVIDGVTYKLNLLPSGIVRENIISIIDQGVVVDPYALIEEINNIPFEITKLMVSEDCHLILSVHKELDKMYEELRLNSKIGTTCKGIGACYEDKVGRRGIRICDIYDNANNLSERIVNLLQHHNAIRKTLNATEVTSDQIIKEISTISDKIAPYIVNRRAIFKILSTKKILFEGAQGCLLDINYGTYPFVTSSSTIKSNYITDDNVILGIAKAYITRVGNGQFPTEQENIIGRHLKEKGKEIGTVSGRDRRCGWFDVPLIKEAIQVSGAHGIALTKLDVLDGIDQIKICTHYECNGKKYDHFPSKFAIQSNLTPMYQSLSGWEESTHKVTQVERLPRNAIAYIKKIEELIKVPIVMISTGADRNDIILLI